MESTLAKDLELAFLKKKKKGGGEYFLEQHGMVLSSAQNTMWLSKNAEE